MRKLVKKDCNQHIFISEGNKKLVETELEYFLIFNIPSITTCPWSTALCRESCYANKSEIQYPDVLPCRNRNLDEITKYTFVEDMNLWIKWHLSRPSKQGKQCYFRIHESGDFMTKTYLLDWVAIAISNPSVIFMAYTKSVLLIQSTFIPKNLVIRYSIWEDTIKRDINIASQLDLPIYTAFTKDVLKDKIDNDGYTLCDCDCTNCKKCYSNNVKKIAVCIH